MDKIPMSFEIRADLVKRLKTVTDKRRAYPNRPPTQTAVVERGLELALEELKQRERA